MRRAIGCAGRIVLLEGLAIVREGLLRAGGGFLRMSAECVAAMKAMIVFENALVDYFPKLGAGDSASGPSQEPAKNRTGDAANTDADRAGDHAHGGAHARATEHTSGTAGRATDESDGTARFLAAIERFDISGIT